MDENRARRDESPSIKDYTARSTDPGFPGTGVVASLSEGQRILYRLLVDDDRHGPLPALLLALTVVTGLVDAVSILSLGRVFVANMTGNVVFIGFALAGAPGFSLAASLSALAGFVVGAGTAGRTVVRLRSHRGRLLLAGSSIELVCWPQDC